MGSYHRVREGEHLAGIVARHGIADFETVWNLPENAELRERRKNPHVLQPGDRVFLPDKARREERRATEQAHRFQVKRKSLVLRIDTRDLAEEPLADTPCVLTIRDRRYELTTDSEGRIEQAILPTDRDATLEIEGMIFPLRIGHLDPIDTPKGQIERLRNLGYAEGDPEDDFETLALAVEEFQRDHDLEADGVCDEETQQKLLEEHGC